jgi:hypothetical protein
LCRGRGGLDEDAADDAEEDVSADDSAGEGLTDDATLIPPGTTVSIASAENTGPQVVYVNFAGPVIEDCNDGSGYCDNSQTKESWIVKDWGYSSFDFAPYVDTAGRDKIMSKLRTWYSPYDITFTSQRPASGPYTMIVISPSLIGPTYIRGRAYINCGNGNPNSIAFVVRIGGSSIGYIARAAAHELGHSIGLLHVTNDSDHMHYNSSGREWLNSQYDSARSPKNADGSPYRCNSEPTQNEPAILAANVGLK